MTSTDATYNGEPRQWLGFVRAIEADIAGLKYSYKTKDDPAHVLGYYYTVHLQNLPPKDELWRNTNIDDLIDETEQQNGEIPPRIKQSIKKFFGSTYGISQDKCLGVAGAMLKILTENASPHLSEMKKIEPLDPFGPIRALKQLKSNFERDVKLGKSSVNQEIQQATQDTPKFLSSRSKANEHFSRIMELIAMGEAARVKILPSEIIASEIIDKIMRTDGTPPLMLQALRSIQDNPPSNLEDLQNVILREIPSHDGKILHDVTDADHEQENLDKILLALSKQQSALFAGKRQKLPLVQKFDIQKSSRSTIHKDKRNSKYSMGSASREDKTASNSTKFQIPNIPKKIWDKLTEEARKEFIEARRKIYKISKGEGTNDEESPEVADLVLDFNDIRLRRAAALMARVQDVQEDFLDDDVMPPLVADSDSDDDEPVVSSHVATANNLEAPASALAAISPQDSLKTIDSGCSSHTWTNLGDFINPRPHKVQITTASKGGVM